MLSITYKTMVSILIAFVMNHVKCILNENKTLLPQIQTYNQGCQWRWFHEDQHVDRRLISRWSSNFFCCGKSHCALWSGNRFLRKQKKHSFKMFREQYWIQQKKHNTTYFTNTLLPLQHISRPKCDYDTDKKCSNVDDD